MSFVTGFTNTFVSTMAVTMMSTSVFLGPERMASIRIDGQSQGYSGTGLTEYVRITAQSEKFRSIGATRGLFGKALESYVKHRETELSWEQYRIEQARQSDESEPSVQPVISMPMDGVITYDGNTMAPSVKIYVDTLAQMNLWTVGVFMNDDVKRRL